MVCQGNVISMTFLWRTNRGLRLYSYNGSQSFKCVIWWALRFPFCVNRLPHILQTNGFSPVWTLICLSSKALRENGLPHIGQDILDFFCWIRFVNDECFLSCWGGHKSSSSELNKKEKVSKIFQTKCKTLNLRNISHNLEELCQQLQLYMVNSL